MKQVSVLLLLLALAAAPLLAQETNTNAVLRIPAAEAKAHIGASAVVTGKIAEVNKAEKLVRLNFEQPFPKQAFTAIIFAARTNLFPNLDGLKGKTVEVSGKIADYRNRPEIELTSTNQLTVIQDPAPAGKK